MSGTQRTEWISIGTVILVAAMAGASIGHCGGPAAWVGDTVMVPLRPVFGHLKATTTHQRGTITAKRGDTTVSLRLGSKQANRNGMAVQLRAAPLLIGTQTYVPASFVREAFGAEVQLQDERVTIAGSGSSLTLLVTWREVALACDFYRAFRARAQLGEAVPVLIEEYPWFTDMYPAVANWPSSGRADRERLLAAVDEDDPRFARMLMENGGSVGDRFEPYREWVHSSGNQLNVEFWPGLPCGIEFGSSVVEFTDDDLWAAKVVDGKWRFETRTL